MITNPPIDNSAVTEGKFAMKNPDVMHTGGQYRTIIAGLLAHIEALPKPLVTKPSEETVVGKTITLPPMGPNEGHGHVWRRHDGRVARCGGPPICYVCAAQLAFVLAKEAP